MTTDTGPHYALKDRELSFREQLEIQCARHRLADLTHRDCELVDFTFTNTKVAFTTSLEERYGLADARDYLMFHVLISSTPNKPFKHYDFPGNDSVRKFLEKAHQEYRETPDASIRF